MTDLRALAEQILAGDFSGLPKVEHEVSRLWEWTVNARRFIDGDPVDLEWMLAQEYAYDAWMHLSEDTQDKWVDFDSWFDANKTRFTAMVGKE